jgi:hypothetical protein
VVLSEGLKSWEFALREEDVSVSSLTSLDLFSSHDVLHSRKNAFGKNRCETNDFNLTVNRFCLDEVVELPLLSPNLFWFNFAIFVGL